MFFLPVSNTLTKNEKPMDLWHFESTFFFYGLFTLLSCIAFMFERFSTRKKPQQNGNSKNDITVKTTIDKDSSYLQFSTFTYYH